MDAIAEVKVLTSGYRAEFGRTGGANIQIVTKSGSSDYQGNLFYYGRRDKFNANTWENNRRGLPRAEYVQNTTASTSAGPSRSRASTTRGTTRSCSSSTPSRTRTCRPRPAAPLPDAHRPRAGRQLLADAGLERAASSSCAIP
jgi:hypothetical protein